MGRLLPPLAGADRRGAEAAMSVAALKPGAIGYVDALTRRPGETVTLRVSVLDPSRRYRAGLYRLLCGETGPKGPGLREEHLPSGADGEREGGPQYTDCGSYASVDLPTLTGAIELTLLVCPTLPGKNVQV